MADIFKPGKASSETTQTQIASPAKRAAMIAILQGLAGRSIGGYPGVAGKPPLKLDLAGLIELIKTNPDALNKVITQVGSGRPASPSTFQNLASGATTLALLAKVLTDKSEGGTSLGGGVLDFLRKLGINIGGQTDAPTDSGYGMWPQNVGESDAFDFGYDSGDGTYGVNASDIASDSYWDDLFG